MHHCVRVRMCVRVCAHAWMLEQHHIEKKIVEGVYRPIMLIIIMIFPESVAKGDSIN